MTLPVDESEAAPFNPYGFTWGPVEATRCCTLPGGRRVVRVKTEYQTLDIYVSATGRSVRVFDRGNGEMLLPDAAQGQP